MYKICCGVVGLGRKINFNVDQRITLNGSLSYDPDCPECELSYTWTCHLQNPDDQPCFKNSTTDR